MSSTSNTTAQATEQTPRRGRGAPRGPRESTLRAQAEAARVEAETEAGVRIGPGGQLERYGFFGWAPVENFLRPTSWELTRRALQYTKASPEAQALRPFERVRFAVDLVRSAQR